MNHPVQTPRTKGSRLAWSLLAVFSILIVAAVWFAVINAHDLLNDMLFIVIFTGMGTVGALVASRQPGNAVGWLYVAFAGNAAVVFFADEYARFALITRPGSLPASEWAAFASESLWVGIITIPFVFIPLFFPDGKLPSTRWRPYAWVAAAFVTFAGIVFALAPGRYLGADNPIGVKAIEPVVTFMEGPGFVVLLALGFTSFASLVLRYRRAGAEQRQQIKWVVYGIAVLIVWFVVEGVTDVLSVDMPTVVEDIGVAIAFGALPVTAGVAMLRHRLFDVDVVIRKTVVVGVLAAFITGAYFLVVVGIPTMLFGAPGGAESLVPFVTAAVVAVAFQPVRRWARRLADRLVYGKRATPYEVLSEFADRMAETYSLDDVLPRLVRLVAEGTGARRVGVWVHVGGELRREAVWPSEDGDWPASLPLGVTEIRDATRSVPVVQRGELLGILALEMPPRESLTPTHEKLLDDVAAQAALVLRNVALIEELRASRQRIVTAQDAERRKLERNLHDGAQQQLVALAVRLKLAEALARKKAPDVADMLDGLRTETTDALENLRDLARGLYPPLLADHGLGAALAAQARKAAVPVEVDADGIGRYPQEVEAAVYFCVLEALQNVSKYAEASQVNVQLAAEDGRLVFAVHDDGRGFDPSVVGRGAGLRNMADRLEALGGTLEIRSAPGAGTTVTGRIGVRSALETSRGSSSETRLGAFR